MMRYILEIGCGQGFNVGVLSRSSKNKVIGIDLSSKDISIAKRRYPQAKFRTMNAEDLSFDDNTFDAVYAIEILEHVEKLDTVLSEIQRVLKKGGKLIASIPYYNSEKWLLKIRPTYFEEINHVRIFKKNELEKLCAKKGFSILKKERRGFLQHIELYFLFQRKISSNSQISIGSWRDNIFTKFLHAVLLYLDPLVLKTPLVYVPIWVLTVPVGMTISYFGNMVFPKGYYYEFEKK